MFKQIILKLYRPVYLLHVSIKKMVLKRRWSRYEKSLRYPLSDRCSASMDTNKTYLILAPHSDDEWIGCSQVLRNCSKSFVCYMNMPGTESKEVRQVRYLEIKKSVETLGRRLFEVGDDKQEALIDIIKSILPDYILVPYFFDWHHAHIAVMQLLKQSLEISGYTCNVMMYQVSVPMPVKACNICLPMSKKEQKAKWRFFFDVYKTQSFMPAKRFMVYETLAGGLVGADSAEVYSLESSPEWSEKLNTMILEETIRYDIKDQLNNIPVVLDKVNSIYNEKF